MKKLQKDNRRWARASVKALVDEGATERAPGKAVITFSTGTLDRQGDTVNPQGWDFRNFNENPVILYGHNMYEDKLPIGKATREPWVDGNQAKVEVQFDMADPFAAQVYGKIDRGYLNMSSAGFLVLEEGTSDPGDYTIRKQELLEVSVVPVPANAQARIELLSVKGMEPITEQEYVAKKTKDVTPVVEEKAVVPYEAYKPVDETTWDWAKEDQGVRTWATVDGKVDFTKYRQAFTWYDNANAENFGAYKLPHHAVRDGALVTHRRGVMAAMQRLGQTDLPESDKTAAYNHLKKHYAQFDLEAPPLKSFDQLVEEYYAGTPCPPQQQSKEDTATITTETTTTDTTPVVLDEEQRAALEAKMAGVVAKYENLQQEIEHLKTIDRAKTDELTALRAKQRAAKATAEARTIVAEAARRALAVMREATASAKKE